MFFLGTGIRTRLLEEGAFHCPVCECEQPYSRKFAQRYFTFFFFPVMALEAIGDYVECYVCDHKFDPSVLHQHGIEGRRRLVEDLLRAVCAAFAHIVGCGAPLTPERAAELAATIQRSFPGKGDVAALCAQLQRRFPDFDSLRLALHPARDGLTDDAKENLLRLAGEACIEQHGRAYLGVACETMKEVGEILGLSPAHIRGLTVQLEESVAR